MIVTPIATVSDRQAPPQPQTLPSFAKKKPPLHLHIAAFIIGVHLIALLGFFTFTWQAFFVCLFLHWLTGCLGITLGFHRLLTHRSFKTPKLIEYTLAVIGSLACQGGPLTWVTAHRMHHAYSDNEGDPHSPLHGFFWAHMQWCMSKNEVLDHPERAFKYAPDLAKDPVHVFLNRFYLAWTVILGAALYVWGGWPFVIWGIFVRLVLLYHSTWFVNSAAHVWGYRTYKSDDQSTNLWWVALLTYGEGWHNNHHAFQFSARHGLHWWELDVTYGVVKLLEMFGLASAVKLPSKHLREQSLRNSLSAKN